MKATDHGKTRLKKNHKKQQPNKNPVITSILFLSYKKTLNSLDSILLIFLKTLSLTSFNKTSCFSFDTLKSFFDL